MAGSLLPKWPIRYGNPVALHCRAALCRATFLRIWGGCRKRIVLHLVKGRCSTYFFSSYRQSVALQIASWEVSLYKGVSQLHCPCCATMGHLVLGAVLSHLPCEILRAIFGQSCLKFLASFWEKLVSGRQILVNFSQF